MYKVDSPDAVDFINHQEIIETLEYARTHRNDRELIRNLIEKARLCKGLTHREAAILLECAEEDLTKEIYGYLMNMAKHKSIDKVFKTYQLESDLKLECSLVDAGTDTEFYYAEVEFPDEETANNFILPISGIEVTEDKKYKMKNYYMNRG